MPFRKKKQNTIYLQFRIFYWYLIAPNALHYDYPMANLLDYLRNGLAGFYESIIKIRKNLQIFIVGYLAKPNTQKRMNSLFKQKINPIFSVYFWQTKPWNRFILHTISFACQINLTNMKSLIIKCKRIWTVDREKLIYTNLDKRAIWMVWK